jgi:hypothetical protein
MKDSNHFKIFISSADDVDEERDIAEEVIREVDRSFRSFTDSSAESWNWKYQPPLTPPLRPGQDIQDLILEELKQCNVFLLILYRRYGSVHSGYTQSNLAREVDTALEMLKSRQSIMFLSYFRDIPPDADPGRQETQVRDLRGQLESQGVWYKTYKDPQEFKYLLTHDLYRTILRFRESTKERKALQAFWQLGIADGDTIPRLAIIYPQIDRDYLREDDPDEIWLDRLVPHVAFEDSKCLQKIKKTLRLIGFTNYRSHSTTSANYPHDIQEINRAWICLPRNHPGLQQASLYKDMANFHFEPRRQRRESRIYWRSPATDNEFITIRSPICKYLQEQRRDSPGGGWRPEHGKNVARDFAIVARFSAPEDRVPMTAGTLKDFFFAGIRGLGTWGTGQLLDRNWGLLEPFIGKGEDAAIQLLIEVTYCNERIVKVCNVSDEPEDYFKNEFKTSTIRQRISEFSYT